MYVLEEIKVRMEENRSFPVCHWGILCIKKKIEKHVTASYGSEKII